MATAISRRVFYDVFDVMAILGVSRSKAYGVIRELNEELKTNGYSVHNNGRVSKKYFNEKFYCDPDDMKDLEAARQEVINNGL